MFHGRKKINTLINIETRQRTLFPKDITPRKYMFEIIL